MAAIGFVVPVQPGKEQADLDWMEEMQGARSDEYAASWRQLGVKRHTVWHQETPDGTVAVVFMEAEDVAAAMQAIAVSDDPFNKWFRDRVQDVHGIDLTSDSPPQAQQIHDAAF